MIWITLITIGFIVVIIKTGVFLVERILNIIALLQGEDPPFPLF